jgi:hypothetical protein
MGMVSGRGRSFAIHFGIHPTAAIDVEPLCGSSGNAGCTKAACDRLHCIEQRLARWLPMTQDRMDSESLPITHDFLATMLGTDRQSVNLAPGILQKKKLIEYTRWRSEDCEPQEP